MPLDQILKLLSAARFPLAIGLFGLVLNVGGSNLFLKNAGATVGLLATGCAVATATRKDGNLREVERLTVSHTRREAALQASIDSALTDVAKAQQEAQQQAQRHLANAEHAKGAFNQVCAERERMRQEVLGMGAQINAASTALGTCRDDNSLIAGQLETLEIERMQLIYELYETAVTEADLGSAIASLESQFQSAQGDTAYQLTQKKKLKSAVTQARANFHTEISDAHSRIAELESELAQKTKLAENMIAELDSINGGQLTHFSGKASAQSEVIRSLQTQLEEQRKTTKALQYRRFDPVGTDNIFGNRLIDYLAKHEMSYGAFSHEREGLNGRLKVSLDLIDTTLEKAKKSLEDMEAELKLWATPTVKIHGGRHVFTLATEQEHKQVQLPADNLKRLENDFDKANHIRLVGPTGSGKSTFLDNLIWLGRLLWPTAKMDLLDPKAPYTKWEGGIVPDFKNLECVAAIENISRELQARFTDANKIADEFGNDSPEFERYVDELPYKLFVLDEAQYLYRIARAEDGKAKPKGIMANTVRDSLLDCLGVGRALKVKGYFITQSGKCSKLGMNDDDFDNATSIFLGSAISNALEGELKGDFSDAKLDKVRADYDKRKALGQRYLGLIAYAETDTLYLFQLPQPGYYSSQVLTAKAAPDPGEAQKVQTDVSTATLETEQGTAGGTAAPLYPTAPTAVPSEILAEGAAACPSCGEFSTTIRNGKKNTLGKVKFACKNTACKKQIFSAQPTR